MTKNETDKALPLKPETRLSKEVLGARLTQLREFHLQTQQAFADKLGVCRQTLASWEQGVSLPSLSYMLKLRDSYKISMEDFLNPSIPVEAICTKAVKLEEWEQKIKEWEEQKQKEQETQTKNFVMFAQALIAAVILFSTTYPLVGLPLCVAYFLLKKHLGVQNRLLDIISILCLIFNCYGTYWILDELFFHFGYGEVEKIASCFKLFIF